MNFLKKVLMIFVAVLLTLFALSVVIKHNPSDSGKESVSESEQYSESKTAGGETGSEKESEKGSGRDVISNFHQCMNALCTCCMVRFLLLRQE